MRISSDTGCDSREGRGKNHRQKKKIGEPDENERTEKVADFIRSHVVLFLLTRKDRIASLQDISDYLTAVQPFYTAGEISFQHALDQVRKVLGDDDLSQFIQGNSSTFQSSVTKHPVGGPSDRTIRLLVEPCQTSSSTVEDFYLKSQVSLFLQTQPTKTALSHAVGTFLATIPPAYSFSSFQHALEQLKRRHKRLSSFAQKYPSVFEWQAGETNNENPSIRLILDSTVETVAAETERQSSTQPLLPKQGSDEGAFLKVQVIRYLQKHNGATPAGDIGTHLASIPAGCDDSSSCSNALEQLKQRYGRLSSFFKKHSCTFRIHDDNLIRLKQPQKLLVRPDHTAECGDSASSQHRNAPSVISKVDNSKNSSSPPLHPIVLLRRDRSSDTANKEEPNGKNVKSRTRNIAASNQQPRGIKVPVKPLMNGKQEKRKNREIPAQNASPQVRQVDELLAALESMTEERDKERKAKNEAIQLAKELRQDKIRIESLWKDAMQNRDSLRKQLKESQSSLAETRGELIKGKRASAESDQLIAKLQLEKEHLGALWKDARRETLSTKKQVQLTLSEQQTKQSLLVEKEVQNGVERMSEQLRGDKERMEVLWKDAKAEQEILKALLDNSKAEVARVRQLLSKESSERHEATMQLSRALNLLDQLNGRGGDRQLFTRLRTELLITQDRLSQGQSRAAEATMVERSNAGKPGKVKFGGAAIKPRVLTRNETPRQRPSERAGVSEPFATTILEETLLHFDGTKNQWNGGEGKEDKDEEGEVNRLEAELAFVGASYGKEEIQVEASKVTRFLRFDIDDRSESILVNLVLSIPDGYPDSAALTVEATISQNAECSAQGRKCTLDALPSMVNCCRWEAQGCAGSEALLAVLSTADSWVQSEWAGIQSKKFPPTIKCNAQGDSTVEMCRMLLYSHHIIDADKIHYLKSTASKMGLGGYIRVGKPGFVLLEGLEVNCESFFERLVVQRKKLRESGRGNTDSSTFSKVGRTLHAVDTVESGRLLPKKIQSLDSQDSLDAVKRACEQVDLLDQIEDACKQ